MNTVLIPTPDTDSASPRLRVALVRFRAALGSGATLPPDARRWLEETATAFRLELFVHREVFDQILATSPAMQSHVTELMERDVHLGSSLGDLRERLRRWVRAPRARRGSAEHAAEGVQLGRDLLHWARTCRRHEAAIDACLGEALYRDEGGGD